MTIEEYNELIPQLNPDTYYMATLDFVKLRTAVTYIKDTMEEDTDLATHIPAKMKYGFENWIDDGSGKGLLLNLRAINRVLISLGYEGNIVYPSYKDINSVPHDYIIKNAILQYLENKEPICQPLQNLSR